MTSQVRLLLTLLLLLFTIIGCADGSATVAVTETPIFFPQQEPAEGEIVFRTAEIEGELVLVGECLRISSSYSNDSYLLVWPPDLFTVDTDDGTVQVYDQEGQVLAHLGDIVHISGGGITMSSSPAYAEYLQQKFPSSCPEPYWLVGNELSRITSTPEPGP